MKLIRIIFFTFLFSNTLFSQVEKIIYFNLKWEKTTKDKASYYRKLPLKEKEGKVLIKDYYMSGAIQMQGWAKKNDEDFLEGDVKWFYENGNLHKSAFYIHNEIIGAYGLSGGYKEYHENGNIYKEENYFYGDKTEKANYYDQKGKLIASCVYRNDKPHEGKTNCFTVHKEGKLVERKLFYENTEQLAFEVYYNDHGYKKREVYYKKNGEVLKSPKGRGNNFTAKFYPSKKCGYVIGIKRFKEGLDYVGPADKEFFYDKKGEILFQGINKHGKPFNGVFYESDRRLAEENEDELYYHITYKQGEVQNEKSFLKNSLFTNGNYVEGKPYNGSFTFTTYFSISAKYKVQSSIVYTLKNGIKEGKETYYERIKDIKSDNALAYFNYAKGIKEGVSIIYDKYSDKEYKMVYKKNKPYNGVLKKNGDILEYKRGKIIKEKKRIFYKDYSYFEIYKNKIKVAIEYDFLDADRKEIESGILKKGKPYNGYFFNKKIKKTTLDYYRKGIKKTNLSKILQDVEVIEIIDN